MRSLVLLRFTKSETQNKISSPSGDTLNYRAAILEANDHVCPHQRQERLPANSSLSTRSILTTSVAAKLLPAIIETPDHACPLQRYSYVPVSDY